MQGRKVASLHHQRARPSPPPPPPPPSSSTHAHQPPKLSKSQKDMSFLRSYNALFGTKGATRLGEADKHFRQSLRSYADFRIFHHSGGGSSTVAEGGTASYWSAGDFAANSYSSKRRGGKARSVSCTGRKKTSFELEAGDSAASNELITLYAATSKDRLSDTFKRELPKEKAAMAEEISDFEAEDEEEDEAFGGGEEEMESVMKDVKNLVEQASAELQNAIGDDQQLQEALKKSIEEIQEAVEHADTNQLEQSIRSMSKVLAGEEEEEDEEYGEDEGEEFVPAVRSQTELQETELIEGEGAAAVKQSKEEKPSAAASEGKLRDVPTEYGDGTLLKELEMAELQARSTARIINELKIRVGELLSKPKMTEDETRELEEKNKQLREHLELFEAKTRRIQELVERADIQTTAWLPSKDEKRAEDMLPKVIICGTTDNNMPKIIICDSQKKKAAAAAAAAQAAAQAPQTKGQPPVDIAKRLCECYNLQDKLAAENADLEGKRYQLQEELINKDQATECLQRKICSLQTEMRLLAKENATLNERLQQKQPPSLQQQQQQSASGPCPASAQGGKAICPKQRSKMPCPKGVAGGGGICPADVEARLQRYSTTTHTLEKQLVMMENEVRQMQTELVAVQRDRMDQSRRSGGGPASCGLLDQQLRELREQYNRLQEDYKNKLTEVAGLRAEGEGLRQAAQEADKARQRAEERLHALDQDKDRASDARQMLKTSREQLVELEQQLNVAKQRFREAQDELEELRALIQDQSIHLDDYRGKYLVAQQQVEEQRRQLDLMEMENARIGEQVALEIQRVKNQFQERLAELTPLPEVLKATQMKLQEVQQLHAMSERNNEALLRELQAYRDKMGALTNQMEKVRSDQQLGIDERVNMQTRLQNAEARVSELEVESSRLRSELVRAGDEAASLQKRLDEKLHEVTQLAGQLETVREESARQVARTKDRCETVRRSMQNQVGDLEHQLAQSRALARAAQRDRDEIRAKMQSQINNLNDNFLEAQMRIKSLQGHVNFLKNSYQSVFEGGSAMGAGGGSAGGRGGAQQQAVTAGDLSELCDCKN